MRSENCPIQIRRLTKTFRNGVVAVNGLNLSVGEGAVYGLVGRNGAGKTTALRLLLGLLRPDSGEVRVLGHDWWEAPQAQRQRVAYVSQASPHPEWLSLKELCSYTSRFYRRWDETIATQLVRRWELPWKCPLGQLSGGNQRLVSMVVALAAQPDVLVLDEPGSGLDPVARRGLMSSLAEALARNPRLTILLSTHLLGDLERLATHVGILDRGRLLTEGRVEDWVSTMRRVQVVFPGKNVPNEFEIPGALRHESLGPVYVGVVKIIDNAQLNMAQRWPDARIQVFPLNLEELFLALYPNNSTRADLESEATPLETHTGRDKASASSHYS